MAIAFSLIAGLQAMEMEVEEQCQGIQFHSDQIPEEVWGEIFITASNHKDKILELGSEVSYEAVFGNFGNFQLVCKDWKNTIDNQMNNNKKEFFKNSLISAYETIGHGDICRIFLNGILKYTPDEGAKVIELRIMDLKYPFAGEFNLSKCGDAWKHLSICTGYRKGKNPENDNKLEIWFAPRFVIERDLKGPAAHFNPIFNTWDGTIAPIGIFWTGGWWNGLEDFWHVTNKDIQFISSDNLLKLRTGCDSQYRSITAAVRLSVVSDFFTQKFHVYFKQKLG